MPHRAWKTACLLLGLAVVLVGDVQAQQQQHPGSPRAPQPPSVETSPGVPAQPHQMQGMMENMQGMMQHMQSMMERMHGMMGRQGMGGMMGRQGMGRTAQEEEDEGEDEEASPQRGMMGRHMERLAQQLELTDDQQTQVRMLMRTHAKEAIRLRADIGMLGIDIQQVLETDPVDLPKAKQLFQSMAMKEADLRLAHLTLMQEVAKLLTPEQQKKFRTMRARLMSIGRMMGPGGMPGRGRGER